MTRRYVMNTMNTINPDDMQVRYEYHEYAVAGRCGGAL